MSVNIYSNPQYADIPYGLKLQQIIYSSGPVTIPANIKRVYAICIGGGGGGSTTIAGGGGGAGGYSAGWTYAANTCTVGAGGQGGSPFNASLLLNGAPGGATIYGMVIAGGGQGAAGAARQAGGDDRRP